MDDPLIIDLRNVMSKYYTDPSYRKKLEIIEKAIKSVELVSNKFLNYATSGHSCISFEQLGEALNNKQMGNILIYVENIDKYLLFNNAGKYASFIDNVEGEIVIQYQVVLTSDKQRVVVSYAHPANIELKEDIKKILEQSVEKEYGTNTKVWIRRNNKYDIHEIVIDKQTDNVEEYSADCCRKLYNSIKTKHPSIANNLHPVRIETEPITKKEYSIYSISNDIKPYCTETDILDLLVGLSNVSTINNLTIMIGNNTNNTTQIIVKTNQQIASEWIDKNPPTISNQEYYKKYSECNKDGLSIQKFAKLMKEKGYKKGRGGSASKWEKTNKSL